MPHELDASGNPILRHKRPSPRTGTTGAGIQKFGTQQLKYLDPQIPALGVIEKDVGARTRLYYGGEATTPKTLFSATYQQQRPETIRTFEQLETSPHAQPEWEGFGFPDLTTLFPPASPNGNGEDCGWFGEKCWCDPPDLGWVNWVLVAIGIGILLWLLRPLFGIAKNITET